MVNSIARSGLLSLHLFLTVCLSRSGEVRVSILDQASGNPVAARVHLIDANGKAQRPAGLPFWSDHFVCDGKAALELPDGSYTYTVERGPEFTAASGRFELPAAQERPVTVRLRRIVNLPEEGWFSGETHVHRPLKDVELLMRAEDLHVAQVITWWNRTNPWKDSAPPAAVRNFDGNRFYQLVSGEDERDGGALLFCDLQKPLEITRGAQHFPSSLVYAREARQLGAKWLDAEKPFWWDFPLWLAHGMADTVGIAHNHMHRGGVLENEAWGRSRDRKKYPGPHGNALWTQQIYYHALNGGLRLPPSAGSASGVLPNPPGYNRAYVHIEGRFTYEKWRDGLLAGRSFVSNGPLLRCRANGKLPGEVFKDDRPIEVTLEGEVDSRDQIKSVELVRNGLVEQIKLPAKFTVQKSGWFLVRAVTDLTNTFRFASTAPWYVEIGGLPQAVPTDSARFFIDWSKERMKTLENRPELTAAQREQVLQPWRATLKFWEDKLAGPSPAGTVIQ